MNEQLDLFAVSENESTKEKKFPQESHLTPRQWALYRLIYHNSFIERRKTTQKEICEKLADYGYVYSETNGTTDKCSMIWNDVNANNMSLEHDKIIITKKYVYWIGNERETKQFLAKLWRDLSPRMVRYWFFVYKVGYDALVKVLYEKYPYDGKFIETDFEEVIICQSNIKTEDFINSYRNFFQGFKVKVNPLGDWTGGLDVDSGATNRKLGSDMADSVTGGGLHGKDLSKADVSVNIYAFLKAQATKQTVKLSCAIGDETIDGKPYNEIVEIARNYIKRIGGFEKFAEWGLVG